MVSSSCVGDVHKWECFLRQRCQKKDNFIYIDDISEGIHLSENISLDSGKMVDWMKVDQEFIKYNLY